MKMSTLIETVSKKPIEPWVRSVIVEIMCDLEDEDVEVCGNGCTAAPRTPRSDPD